MTERKIDVNNFLRKAFLSNRQKDWFDELTEVQQKDVLAGLAEADKGNTVPHAEVVKIYSKWGLK